MEERRGGGCALSVGGGVGGCGGSVDVAVGVAAVVAAGGRGRAGLGPLGPWPCELCLRAHAGRAAPRRSGRESREERRRCERPNFQRKRHLEAAVPFIYRPGLQ